LFQLLSTAILCKIFGSVDSGDRQAFQILGRQAGRSVGVVEDGKYETVTEDPKPAMFFPFLQQPSSDTWIVVRIGDTAAPSRQA
jgi:hypothetical protein